MPATSVSQLKQQLVIDQINAFLANPAQQQLRISSTQHPVMGIPLVLGGLAMGLLIKSAHRNRVPRVPRFVTDPQRPRGSRTTPPRRKKVKHH
ncbi:MAG: hypothetical protein U0232_14425 [Thermomicrobiales bacterium]